MRTIFLICFLVSICRTALGQSKTMDPGSDSSTYPFGFVQAEKAGLKDLKSSVFKSHYRFWKAGQIVEIWSEDNVAYHGSILSFIFKYKKMDKLNGIILKREAINDGKARQIVGMYNSLLIDKIPTEKQIPGWVTGLDGEIFAIEYSTSDSYSYKEYWEAEEQKSEQGKTINKFYTQLKTVLELGSRYNAFENDLPLGKYVIGMMIMHKYQSPKKPKGGSYLF